MASPREPYVHTYNQGSVYREEWCSNPESNVLSLTRYCELVQLQNVRKEVEVSRGGQHRGTSPSRGVVTRKSLPGEGGAKGKLRGHSDQEVTRPKLPSITYGNGGMGWAPTAKGGKIIASWYVATSPSPPLLLIEKSPLSRFNKGKSLLFPESHWAVPQAPEGKKRVEEWGTGATMSQRKAPQEESVPTAESVC